MITENTSLTLRRLAVIEALLISKVRVFGMSRSAAYADEMTILRQRAFRISFFRASAARSADICRPIATTAMVSESVD
jgi:hypothetical protein